MLNNTIGDKMTLNLSKQLNLSLENVTNQFGMFNNPRIQSTRKSKKGKNLKKMIDGTLSYI